MKALLSTHELTGTADAWERQLTERKDQLSDKTLGTLVKSLFETYVVPDGFERDLVPKETISSEQISMTVAHRIQMSPEALEETRSAIESLVAMRNELVHHFIERFDIFTDEGCIKGVSYLEGCYDQIDQHFRQLAEWARTMDEARIATVQFMQSTQFIELLVNDNTPNAAVEWQHTGIVRELRDVVRKLGVDGWHSVDRARELILLRSPDQTPQHYGYRTWPQLLSESRLFDLEYRVDSDDRKSLWYRERSHGRRTIAP